MLVSSGDARVASNVCRFVHLSRKKATFPDALPDDERQLQKALSCAHPQALSLRLVCLRKMAQVFARLVESQQGRCVGVRFGGRASLVARSMGALSHTMARLAGSM